MANRVVLLKQSGERLTAQPSEPWTPAEVAHSAEKIKTLTSKADNLEISGVVLISGAGNITRGEKLKEYGIGGALADAAGRLATIQNTLILQAALDDRRVPSSLFISPNMGFHDPTVGMIDPWDDEAVTEAMAKGRVVLVCGGTGEDGVTTDNAVVTYGARLRAHDDTVDVEVIKGTKRDGIYESDPAVNANARRFSLIAASTMLAQGLGGVDKGSLHQLLAHDMSMRVFADAEHDLVHVLHPSNIEGMAVGTLIVGHECQPVLAD